MTNIREREAKLLCDFQDFPSITFFLMQFYKWKEQSTDDTEHKMERTEYWRELEIEIIWRKKF